MDKQDIVGSEWDYVLSLMPDDLEESSKSKLAIRRYREISSAGDLLRLCLAFGFCQMSLRQVAAWAETIGLGEMSNVAVMKRLIGASDWLGALVTQWLTDRGLTTNVPQKSVRIIDASCIKEPGSKKTGYRLHLAFDLGRMRITEVEVTDRYEGETLKRHRVVGGEIFLGDRGYAHPAGIGEVLDQGGHVLIRTNWKNLALKTVKGTDLQVIPLLKALGKNAVGDWPVILKVGRKKHKLRLIAIKKTKAATEKAQDELKRRARKEDWELDKRTIQAAGYILLVTDLQADELPALQALELYRFRWQIELMFKRLKSISQLNQLRAKKPELAKTYILANLLGALIIEELTGSALSFFPWGFRLPGTPSFPLASLFSME